MILFILLFGFFLKGTQVHGIDVNSAIPRLNCYPTTQPNCNEDLIEAYPELSHSVTGLTKAETWLFLFTRENPDTPELLHKCGGRLPPNSNFNPNNRLIVILTPFIAGFCDVAVYREWKVQFLKREDVNVLAVDYSWGQHIDYGTALENIKIVAKQVVKVLHNIQDETGLESSQIYMIGHSLGAQLGGLIGNMTKIGRITGLDPAGPGYPEDKPLAERLDRSDATLVDIWHTNAGKCLPFLGIKYDAGDLDFWFNGGKFQTSCFKYAFESFLKRDYIYAIGTILIPTTCSHAQVAQYYKVSINPEKCQFVGIQCDSYLKYKAGLCRSCGQQGEKCIIVGYDTDKYVNNSTNFPQKYYVHTSLDCPYCDNSFIKLDGFKDTYESSLQTQR